MFDRSDDEWESIVTDTVEILKQQAQLRRVTSYSDVNAALARRCHRPFDFSNQNDRTAMGAVLGDVVKKTLGETRVMVSAIVVYIDRNDAGPGFYNLAVQLGLLPNTATSDDKLAFWSNQVAQVHELHARPKRQPGAKKFMTGRWLGCARTRGFRRTDTTQSFEEVIGNFNGVCPTRRRPPTSKSRHCSCFGSGLTLAILR